MLSAAVIGVYIARENRLKSCLRASYQITNDYNSRDDMTAKYKVAMWVNGDDPCFFVKHHYNPISPYREPEYDHTMKSKTSEYSKIHR